jgi:hypothetical protein
MTDTFSYIEIWEESTPRLVPLRGEFVTFGKSEQSDVQIRSDPSISRAHAVLERLGSIWCVRDLGSKNGTIVNGQQVNGQHALHDGDEVRLSRTRLVFRSGEGSDPGSLTVAGQPPPSLTRREKDVLVALCRPLLEGGAFREPADTRKIAGELVVSEGAVKQHLLHLYDKFGIYGTTERRRVQLANEAMARGAVRVSDLTDRPEAG